MSRSLAFIMKPFHSFCSPRNLLKINLWKLCISVDSSSVFIARKEPFLCFYDDKKIPSAKFDRDSDWTLSRTISLHVSFSRTSRYIAITQHLMQYCIFLNTSKLRHLPNKFVLYITFSKIIQTKSGCSI